MDIVVDTSLFLWSKCKAVFQKFQTGFVDNPRYLLKMDDYKKVCVVKLTCVYYVRRSIDRLSYTSTIKLLSPS